MGHGVVQLARQLDPLLGLRLLEPAAPVIVLRARRHAHNATLVEVRVDGDPSSIHLTVRDDGDHIQRRTTESGFGIVGMVERATLLGGACSAGPCPERGWLVEATLPRGVTG